MALQSRSRDMWQEMNALKVVRPSSSRAKRGWLFGQWVPEGGAGGGGAYGAGSLHTLFIY